MKRIDYLEQHMDKCTVTQENVQSSQNVQEDNFLSTIIMIEDVNRNAESL